MRIVPFTSEMLEDAAELLAARHGRHRKSLPHLPEEFATAEGARTALAELWNRPGIAGAAILSSGRLAAYLLGELRVDSLRGRHVWIDPPGFALEEGQSWELYQDLYAHLGALWVKNGFFDHFVLAPAPDWNELQPWLQLSFALEQVHALSALEELPLTDLPTNPNVQIRRAQQGDAALVQSFFDLIPKATAAAPVWGAALPESMPEIKAGYGELLEEEGTVLWLAFLGGEVVGLQAWRTLKAGTSLLIPPATTRLTVASTKPQARGQGAATSLFVQAVSYAQEAGFAYAETDWRVANLPAARLWPKLGLRPAAYRLVRRIDPRIVWADGENQIRI